MSSRKENPRTGQNRCRPCGTLNYGNGGKCKSCGRPLGGQNEASWQAPKRNKRRRK